MQYLPMNSFRIFWALTDQQCRFFHSHLQKPTRWEHWGFVSFMFAFLDVFFILSFAEAWSWSWLVGRGVGGRVGGWGSLVLFSIGRKFDSHSRFHPLHNIHLHHPCHYSWNCFVYNHFNISDTSVYFCLVSQCFGRLIIAQWRMYSLNLSAIDGN